MKLHVGQGTTVGALTVFPIWNDRTHVARRYVTGTETLTVSEMDGGASVPQLLASNDGDQPVLVLDGQLFEGGWQHRMATRSLIVPAGARVVVDVACVEQRRWHGTTEQTSRGRRAGTFVRAGFDVGEQHEVWRRVDGVAAATPTGSLADRLDVGVDVAEQALRRVRPLAGQTGVLVGIAGQPLALEVFDHPDTLREQFEQIIRAAGLDSLGRATVTTPGRRARRMVERLERTRVAHPPSTSSPWRLGRARTTDLDVMSLRDQHDTVHLRATYLRNPILQEA